MAVPSDLGFMNMTFDGRWSVWPGSSDFGRFLQHYSAALTFVREIVAVIVDITSSDTDEQQGMSARQRLTRIMAQMGPKKPKRLPNRTRWNVLRGDKVQVVGHHPEKGKQGIVLQVFRDRDRVLVEGVNFGTKNIKGNPERGIQGRTIQRERTIPYSNVNLVDPVTGQPTRVTRQYLDDGSKVRVAKKSGAVIPRPDILTFRKRPVNNIVTESDTLEEAVWQVTYQP